MLKGENFNMRAFSLEKKKLANLDDYRPHKYGPAECLECGREWVAVMLKEAPDTFECPYCHACKAAWAGVPCSN